MIIRRQTETRFVVDSVLGHAVMWWVIEQERAKNYCCMYVVCVLLEATTTALRPRAAASETAFAC